MTILGVDPGFQFAGFGIIKKEQQRTFVVDYGYLKMNPTHSLDARVGIFYDFFAHKIEKNAVTHLALETPFLGKNAQNFLKLGYLRGILYLLATKNKLIIQEFAPREIKLSLAGWGGASKDEVARVVRRIFPGMEQPKKADVTDALAVTLCGLWRHKTSTIV